MDSRFAQEGERSQRSPNRSCCVGAAIAVLGLVAVTLTALIVIHRARDTAEALSCYGNVARLQLSLRVYAADHADRYPLAGNWCDATLSYGATREVYTCPALGDGRGGYALNKLIGSMAMEDIRDPCSTVTLFDGPPGWNGAGGCDSVVRRHPTGLIGRHWCAAFADGHVKYAYDPSYSVWVP
jgi:hypothetical protein